MPFLEWICFTKTTAISTPMDAVSALTSIKAGFEAGPLARPVHQTWVVQGLRLCAVLIAAYCSPTAFQASWCWSGIPELLQSTGIRASVLL